MSHKSSQMSITYTTLSFKVLDKRLEGDASASSHGTIISAHIVLWN